MPPRIPARWTPRALGLVAPLAALVAVGCDAPAPQAKAEQAASAAGTPQRGPKPDIVRAPDKLDSGRAWVLAEQARAEREGRRLVIDVGATWCEPCVRFHEAVASGRLDQELAGVRLLELDLDVHGALLEPGDLDCKSRLVPLFARPTPEGRCGPQRVEGAIKGEGAVGFLLPKVRALVDG